jgi:hypothetical protein
MKHTGPSKRNPALDEARHIFHKANDPYETGFITWEYKKQLLELQWYLEEVSVVSMRAKKSGSQSKKLTRHSKK